MKTLAPLALLVPLAICSAMAASPTGPGAGGPAAGPPAAGAPPAGGPAARGGGPGGPAAVAATGAPAGSTVSLKAAAGSSIKGDLKLTNEGGAVAVRGEITGLSPGKEH